MQIFVRTLDGQTVGLNADDLQQLKASITSATGVSADQQALSVNGKPLDSAFQLTDDVTVDLNCRLLGGKVHGSLARAGKVRGQTPKVDKQEKKKKKTGRAKRRMQFNRRFAAVAVQGPGRRRGPNANS